MTRLSLIPSADSAFALSNRMIQLMMESERSAAVYDAPLADSIISWTESAFALSNRGWFNWWWNLREARLYMTRLSQIPSAESAFALSNRMIHLMMESARILYDVNQPLAWATAWSLITDQRPSSSLWLFSGSSHCMHFWFLDSLLNKFSLIKKLICYINIWCYMYIFIHKLPLHIFLLLRYCTVFPLI